MKNIDCFSSTLHVMTFIMHGFNTGSNYLCKLMNNYDIILLQEHMLRDVNVDLMTSCNVNVNFNHFLITCTSGYFCMLVNVVHCDDAP